MSLFHRSKRRFLSCRETGEAGFALIYALLFIAMLALLSISILALVLNEVRPTQFERKREQTASTAQAGIDASLSKLRNAVLTSSARGAVAQLPCPNGSDHATLAGSIDATGANTYSATIYYFSSDPSSLTYSQVQSGTAPGRLTCANLATTVPSYAYIESAGSAPAIEGSTASTGNRVIHAVYPFSTSNQLGLGGQISLNGNCWTVASASPSVGSQITFQPCLSAGTPTQSWYYRPDLSVQWLGSAVGATPMCLDYRTFSSSNTLAALTLQNCLTQGVAGDGFNVTTKAYTPSNANFQQFVALNGFEDVYLPSIGDYSNGANQPAGSGHGTSCVASQSLLSSTTVGTGAIGEVLAMHYGSACGDPSSGVSTDAGVGAGDAAGAANGAPGPTGQFSNYKYPRLCYQLLITPTYQIGHPDQSTGPGGGQCGQAPDISTIGGNSVFSYTGTATSPGTISSFRTNDASGNFNYSTACMTSGGVNSVPQFTNCSGGANQQWQLTEAISGNYTGSYLIKDYQGNCLTVINAPQGQSYIASTQTQTCNTNNLTNANQKWNAPPNPTNSTVKGFGEDNHS